MAQLSPRVMDMTPAMMQGTMPSVFPEIDSPELVNYLVIEKYLAPRHGKGDSIGLPGEVKATFRSSETNEVYLVAGKLFGRINEVGVFTQLGELEDDGKCVSIVENKNDQILITDCSNAYIFNTQDSSFSKLDLTINEFDIQNPVSAVMDNLIFFVAGGDKFQASKVNNGLSWEIGQQFTYTPGEDEIKALAIIERVIFVIGQFSIERFVFNNNPLGDDLVLRDNVYLLKEGLSEPLSFVNKLNMAIGIFSSRHGGAAVKIMDKRSPELINISTPGLIQKMFTFGKVDSADLYEIKSLRFYEITFVKVLSGKKIYHSFIYNFSNQTWSESTSPFQKFSLINGIPFAFFLENAFKVKFYENDLVKRCRTPNMSLEGGRNSIHQVRLTVRLSKSQEAKTIKIGGSIDGIRSLIPSEVYLSNSQYIQYADAHLQQDAISYACEFSTESNAKIEFMKYEVE
jgi:hypothetical protein